MLRFIKNITPDSAYGFWEITESFDELASNFDATELTSISNHHPRKQLEYLSTRYLLKALVEHFSFEYSGVQKDNHGKPHLINSPHHISVSHAFPYVVCMLHLSKPCGIDIEKPRDQIIRIKHKFLGKKELEIAREDPKKLCIFWSAKEALYKLYGRKNLLFIENLNVEFSSKNSLNGSIVLDDHITDHDLQIEEKEEHVIVYGV